MAKTEIQFNERTFEAYQNESLDPPNGILSDKARLDKFKSKFKQDKAPLQIIIKSMHRRPVITFDETGKAVKKDYLTYTTEYHGKDWLGNDIWIREHIHGVYNKPTFRVITTLDRETGDYIEKKEYGGIAEEYYIELTEKNRKQVIEEIINKSNGTFVENIRFYYHVPSSIKGPPFRCDQFTYDQFINSSLEELESLARKGIGTVPYSSKDKKSYMV
jgi:hypothetical protein